MPPQLVTCAVSLLLMSTLTGFCSVPLLFQSTPMLRSSRQEPVEAGLFREISRGANALPDENQCAVACSAGVPVAPVGALIRATNRATQVTLPAWRAT